MEAALSLRLHILLLVVRKPHTAATVLSQPSLQSLLPEVSLIHSHVLFLIISPFHSQIWYMLYNLNSRSNPMYQHSHTHSLPHSPQGQHTAHSSQVVAITANHVLYRDPSPHTTLTLTTLPLVAGVPLSLPLMLLPLCRRLDELH